MRTYTHEELKEILDLHKKWLKDKTKGVRANLRYANLRYADLRYADLRYADLSSADLRSTNLSSADLRFANLSYANLRYADLSSSDLSSANLSYANLSYANLSYADLSYADLRYADLRSTNLSSADLRFAIGEMKYIKSLQCEKYYISYTSTNLNIGCQCHTILEWKEFNDDIIRRMGNGALDWWKKWKPILMQIIEASPSLEGGVKE